jgi:hypothetical protein
MNSLKNNKMFGPLEVLNECVQLLEKKSQDYQNDQSFIRHAEYYPRGAETLYDLLHTKMLRIRSLLSVYQSSTTSSPNFESLEDSAKDLINYASFFVAYCRKKLDGQNLKHDIFNRPCSLNTVANDDSEKQLTFSFFDSEERI